MSSSIILSRQPLATLGKLTAGALLGAALAFAILLLTILEDPPSLKPWGEYDFIIHDPDGHSLEFDSPRHQSYTDSRQPEQSKD